MITPQTEHVCDGDGLVMMVHSILIRVSKDTAMNPLYKVNTFAYLGYLETKFIGLHLGEALHATPLH